MSMLVRELLAYLFEGQPHILAQPMETWLDSSRWFADFVTAFRDKIRKKLRVRQDQESLLDLRLELETAYLLLRERSLSLDYEPLQSGKFRSPDFAVTFTTSLTFMVEVTRLRAEQRSAQAESQGRTPATPDAVQTTLLIDERLVDTICSKLGQLLPQRSNVLIVGVDALRLADDDLRATMLHIQQRAERSDSAFFQKYHFRDRAEFFNHYQRLSEILIRNSQLQAGALLASWVNPQAKHPLPGKVRSALYRSHTL